MLETTTQRTFAKMFLIFVVFALSAPARDQARAAEDGAAGIRDLLQQRRDTLANLVQLEMAAFSVGVTTSDTIFDAQRQLIDAELELAGTSEQRLAVLQEQVELAKKLENQVRARVDQGASPRRDLLRAQANRLRAAILLAREREKEKR
jgi:outer membrane protein TolC